MKLINKAKLYFSALLLISLLFLGVASIVYFYNVTKSQTMSYLFSSNRARAEQVNIFISSQKELSSVLAAASVYRDFLKESPSSSNFSTVKNKIYKRFERTKNIDKSILELYILNNSGKIVASSDDEEEGEEESDNLYFTKAKENTYFSDFYYYEPYKKIVYAVSSPVLDDDGSFLGVSVIIFSSDPFYNIVANENGLGKSEENFLINTDRYFLTPSLFKGENVILKEKVLTKNADNCFLKEEVDYVKQNGYKDLRRRAGDKDVVESKDYRGVEIIGTHIYIPETGWCLITKVDKKDFLLVSIRGATIVAGVSVVLLFLFIIFIQIAASRLVNPLLKLIQGTNEVKSGNFDIKVSVDSNDEVGDLSRSFEEMAKAVKESRRDIDTKVKEQTQQIIEKQHDIENQQKATMNILQDVEEEKTKTSALLASIGDGVIATDANVIVIFANKAVENILGWKIEEVLGKKLYDFLEMVDEKGNELADNDRPFSVALKTKNKVTVSLMDNYYYKNKKGEKIPVSISVTPIISENKLIGAINVFRDITHEKEIDKAKTEFVSLASHQLRTPLSAINWYSEMLLAGDAGPINNEQKQYLDEVYKSNKRMVELVNSLLNVSRIDLGTFAIVPESVDIKEVSKSVIMELTPMIKTKKMKIEESYDKSIEKINLDAKLTRIIFQNLLSNAVKYTPEEGKVSVSIAKQDKNVLIKISDTGYGIPKKDQSRMFEKLFRADNVREKETDGTGLGMYIVKSILEQSGGSISFESEENKGTTFKVLIPLSGMKAKGGTKDLS